MTPFQKLAKTLNVEEHVLHNLIAANREECFSPSGFALLTGTTTPFATARLAELRKHGFLTSYGSRAYPNLVTLSQRGRIAADHAVSALRRSSAGRSA